MAKLSEYIGSLVSSITNARVMSDFQTVKVAEEYAKHDLLKHFSIPRMRIDDIEMDIPIALDEIEEKTETYYEPIDNTKFNALAYNAIANSLGVSKLPNALSRELRSVIAKQSQSLEQNIRLTKDLTPLTNFSAELSNKLSDLEKKYSTLLTGTRRNINIEEMPGHLEKTLSPEIKIASQKTTIDNLKIIGETHKLSDQKPENIIHIKLKISESGVEWNRTENNEGKVESKLLPE